MWIGAMCSSQILVKTQRHPNGRIQMVSKWSGPARRAIPIGGKGQQQPPHGHKQQHGQNRQVYLGITLVFFIFVCECVSVKYRQDYVWLQVQRPPEQIFFRNIV